MSTVTAEEEKLALEQRLERLEHRVFLNEKDINRAFWVLAGTTFITWVAMRGMEERLKKTQVQPNFVSLYPMGSRHP